MKADLITLHSVYNYGSVLQTYATQKIFEKHGVNITVINYIRPNNSFFKRLKRSSKGSILKQIILLPSLLTQKIVFDKFCKKRFNLTKNKFSKESDFNLYEFKADFYITGSDQVWNSSWNDGVLGPLYLNFVSEHPKVAFSASFGKECLSDEEVKQTKEMIMDYDLISVREKSAVDILKKQYEYEEPIQILDPTLLITKEEWQSLMDKKFDKKDYILIYQLNSNAKFDKYVEKVAKKNNKKVIRICRRYDQILLNGKSKVIPKVETFISLFNNAGLVITDSFHAISFCLNLNTPFVCIYPSEFSTRLQSCLEMFDLLDRKVDDYNFLNVFDKKIDWLGVNNKLRIEREKASNYIEKCKRLVTLDGEVKS